MDHSRNWRAGTPSATRLSVRKMWIGKLLELVGMIVVLSGFLFGVKYSLIKFELGALAAGSAIFYFGYLLEKKSA